MAFDSSFAVLGGILLQKNSVIYYIPRSSRKNKWENSKSNKRKKSANLELLRTEFL